MKTSKYHKLLLLCFLALISCSTPKPQVVESVVYETVTVKDPGSEEYAWEPPIVDQVEVPPGLDPEGHYYRPSHEEVVEIRQGRWVHKEPKDVRIEEDSADKK